MKNLARVRTLADFGANHLGLGSGENIAVPVSSKLPIWAGERNELLERNLVIPRGALCGFQHDRFDRREQKSGAVDDVAS